MANTKYINNTLDSNLNGSNFNSTASETIFSFGGFAVTSNFEGRHYIDYTNSLSSFVRPVTLETMGVTTGQSRIIQLYTTNAVLNLDRSDLNTFVRFGSAYEFLRVSIQNIILAYPASIFINSQVSRGGNITFSGFSYNQTTNISTFDIPISFIINTYGLVINNGNTSLPENVELKNINLSYGDYIVWSALNSSGNSYTIIGFTGYSSGSQYLHVHTIGNPFPTVTGSSAQIDFHIKPNNEIFEEFRALLSGYEKYIVSERDGVNGFKFTLKDPTLLDDGTITYSNSSMLWATGDGYNIDINTPKYNSFFNILLTIGNKYDLIKTDLIARFLTPASIKTYDLTEAGKMTKLLRIYGKEFDQLREFIDSLVNINKVSYNKLNNIPDQLIKNLSRTLGWDYFSLVNENELVSSFLSIDDEERNLHTDLLPAEIDVELWRRIIINTNYFWKSKGTREAIKSIFLLIGIPEPFINITEYVYTVNGKINPNTVQLAQSDFPSNSLPYDTEGYPAVPLETSDFFFQISGDTDSGQRYLDVFRMAGFKLQQTVDNKKSWIQTGSTTRIHSTTPQYYQEDSKLIINTKEVDVALDDARGIEYDVYDYIQKDFTINSSGYTLPFSYVNISLIYSGNENKFTLPYTVNEIEGDFEVRYNGILLNAPKTGATYYALDNSGNSFTNHIGEKFLIGNISTTGMTQQSDYTVIGNTFTLTNSNIATNSGNRRDVIQATFIYSGGTRPVTGITVEYIVVRVKANSAGTIIPLPSYPRGDVQVTINGIALTKGTSQFTADYILDPNNTIDTNNIIIQNPEVISYLAVNPNIQIAYVQVTGSNDIAARSEVVRVDSFNSGKVYFNLSANKYVYKLNYKANSAKDIKVLINGIALEPPDKDGNGGDYSINPQNLYEVFLPRGIKYNTIITVYYLVGGNAYFNPIVADNFGVGDISQLSFLEFTELIQRRMINARNRKTISDFKGGWYPSLLRIYIEYLKRANLPANDPLRSNGYTFGNLYSFLSKYNAFFQKFVDQLLAATVIMKKSGLLIRNTVFTKQKFTYKRGVNVDSGATINIFYNVAVNVATISNINLISAPTTIDSITLSNGNRILVKNQTSGSTNGIYIFNGGGNTMTRSTDFSGNTQVVNGSYVNVFTGSTNKNTIWVLKTINPIIVGLTTLIFSLLGRIFKTNIDYYGDDGSLFLIDQNIYPPVPVVATMPMVTTTVPTLITQTTATGGGNVTSDGNSTILARGVCWSTSSNPTIANSKTTNAGTTGAFTSTLTPLVASTTYYVRAYATNGIGTAYGTQESFVTPAVVVIPSIETTTASLVDIYSFTTGGENIVGYSLIEYYAIQYKISGSTTWLYSPTSPSAGPLIMNYFIKSITGLSPENNYEYRAYMVVNGTSKFGIIKTIKTLPIPLYIPTITTSGITTITQTTATGGGNVTSDGGTTITYRGVCWSTSSNPTIANSKTTDTGTTGAFTSNLTLLVASTTYYVRAYATNGIGTAYGTQKSFITATEPEHILYLSENSFEFGCQGGFSIAKSFTITSSFEYVTLFDGCTWTSMMGDAGMIMTDGQALLNEIQLSIYNSITKTWSGVVSIYPTLDNISNQLRGCYDFTFVSNNYSGYPADIATITVRQEASTTDPFVSLTEDGRDTHHNNETGEDDPNIVLTDTSGIATTGNINIEINFTPDIWNIGSHVEQPLYWEAIYFDTNLGYYITIGDGNFDIYNQSPTTETITLYAPIAPAILTITVALSTTDIYPD